MGDTLLTNLCAICHISTPKYKCPRGVRDATAYVPKKTLATPAGVDHDYNFISAIERSRERSERVLVGEKGIIGERELRRPVTVENVEYRLRRFDIMAVRAPVGMSRRQENETRYFKRSKRIEWYVELFLVGGEAGVEKERVTMRIADDWKVSDAFLKNKTTKFFGVSGAADAGLPNHDGSQSVPDETSGAWLPAATLCTQNFRTAAWFSKTHPDRPAGGGGGGGGGSGGGASVSSDAVDALKERLSFYLTRPATTSSAPTTLVPFDPSEKLHDVLAGTVVLEYPTLYVIEKRAGIPAGLPATRRPPSAPKPIIDIRHMREDPELYAQNCIERNYARQSTYPHQIRALFEQWQKLQADSRSSARKPTPPSAPSRGSTRPPPPLLLFGLGRALVHRQGSHRRPRRRLTPRPRAQSRAPRRRGSRSRPRRRDAGPRRGRAQPHQRLDPRGDVPRLLSYINDPPPGFGQPGGPSHVDIGTELGILDFAAAASSSGWGWYYLVDGAAELEHALTQYALAVASRHGWRQPRDQNGEQQIYSVARPDDSDPSSSSSSTPSDATAARRRAKPELVLAGTSEIALAGMKADTTLRHETLPSAASPPPAATAPRPAPAASTPRASTASTSSPKSSSSPDAPDQEVADDVFDEMLDIQTEIIGSLGLHCRLLEMPSTDLGASAARKCDIEAYFPPRASAPASPPAPPQSRRLPWTVNGTALAVPRVLAALLENGWDEKTRTVVIPECLRPWMDGKERIEKMVE
ncbi:unnamed protein product [Parascedosporium putredinis]|uniref:BCD1 alpha/beta domain-containing protein n=1 Tax=Parascedosporium putredinis TaxID=1442378 RepID=A0A9P1GX54_9PEZI|nr:unnamed protein product [Parascedosporium putredinis]CAI7988699.1 unnamed protein product [Parascedosporium putredinis]